MNIMAISLDWFMTIPGMLISGGVLLLLIALIIFIVTSVKSKKENKEEIEEVTPVTVESDVMPIEPSVEQVPPVEPITTEMPMAEPVEENKFDPIIQSSIIEISDENNDVVEPMVAPLENIMPEVKPIESVEPVAVPFENIVPEVNPIQDTPVENNESIKAFDFPELDMPEATNLDKTSVSIYGGANPSVTPSMEPEHRPIYGGADPLEATMKMNPITKAESIPVVTPIEEVPEVVPIIPEVTLTEPVLEPIEEPKIAPAVMESAPPTYTVESPIPDVAMPEPSVISEPIPIEIDEKIEEL